MDAPRNILLLGAPASGKGTLAHELHLKFKIPHIATGTILRSEMRQGTPFGRRVAAHVKSGRLLPPELFRDFYDVIKQQLLEAKHGFILDGLPRTLQQAQDLDRILRDIGKQISCVLVLDVEYGVLVDRVAGRLTCSNDECGVSYHSTSRPPKVPMVCDNCHAKLFRRADDTKELLEVRLDKYQETLSQITNYYRNSDQGLVRWLPQAGNDLSSLVKRVEATLSSKL